MLETLQGIMLRTIKYGETSVIADIFTQTHGMRSFMVQSVRKIGGKIPPSVFQPLIWVELVSRVQEKKLSYINDIRVVNPLSQVFFDVRKSALALFMAEVLHKTLDDSTESAPIFNSVVASAQFLNDFADPPPFFAHLFLANLIQLSGSAPNIETFTEYSFFDAKNGIFMPSAASNLTPETILAGTVFELFRHTEMATDETLFNFVPKKTTASRKIVLETLLSYMAWHSPNMKEIFTHKIYQEIWA